MYSYHAAQVQGGGDQTYEFEYCWREPLEAIWDLLYGGHLELLLVAPSKYSVWEGKIRNLKFGAYFEVLGGG